MRRRKKRFCLGGRALFITLLVISMFFFLDYALADDIQGLVTVTTDEAYTNLREGNPEADEGSTRWGTREPLDFESYVPMPVPDTELRSVESLSESDEQNQWVSYNLATNEETIHDGVPPSVPMLRNAFIAGSPRIGNLNPDGVENAGNTDGGATGPLNFSALSLLTTPEIFPWRVNVKLYISFASGNYVASGVLIDSTHVLTAGHCVHDVLNGGTWATSITVVPAYDNGSEPYGDATSVGLHSWAGWTVDADWDHDLGIIELDRPIGGLTGWHGYGYDDDPDFYTSNTFNNPGYPAESPYDGESMYNWYGTFDITESILGFWYGNEVGFNRMAYGGQSGSGAYYISSSGRIVYAALSNGYSTAGGPTYCPRITSGKFATIRDGIIDFHTPSTFDLIPLNVTTTPTMVDAGDSLSAMSYQVINNASVAWSGTVNVDVYLSTNDNISTADTLIQSHSFTHSFDSKETVTVNVSTPPTIPAGTSGGSYYLGVILDISDYSIANNDSDGQDASTLLVDADTTPPPAPVISSSTHPNESVWYTSDDPAFTWTTPPDATGIAGYSFMTSTSSGSIPDTTIDTTANNATAFNLPNGIRYFHVRAEDNAGNWGATDHYRVRIDDTPPIIDAIGNNSVTAGSAYTGPTPTLSQSGPSPITWTLVAGPSGMTISGSTGVVSWSNPTTSGSPHQITIRATSVAGSDDESWTLTVSSLSNPPVIDPIPDSSTTEGTPYTGPTPQLSQGATPITWTLDTGPSGMTIDGSTGVVTWNNPTTSGSPHQITIRATNADGFDQEDWMLTVTTNQAPVLDPIGNKQVTEGELLQFTITATDPDGDNLSCSAANLPAGATLTDQGNGTAVVSWQTASGDDGVYPNIVFTVTDDGTPPMDTSETVTFTVQSSGGGGGGGGGCFLGVMK